MWPVTLSHDTMMNKRILHNVFKPLCQVLTSLHSDMEQNFDELCSLFLKSPIPMSTPTPLRYFDFQAQVTHNEVSDSLACLVSKTCCCYPKVLQIDMEEFSATPIASYCRQNPDFCLEMFGQVEFLYLMYGYNQQCIGDPLESNYLFEDLCKSAAMIFPVSLTSLVIETNRSDVLGFVMESCMPHICETATPLKLRQLTLRVAGTSKSAYSHFQKPRCTHWYHGPGAPLTRKHDQLLQSLSPILSHPQFSSLTLDGIILCKDSQACALVHILRTFLASPTTHTQCLILHRVEATHQFSKYIPTVVSPLKDLQFKSLRIRKTALNQSVISWLLEKSQLCLNTLEFEELQEVKDESYNPRVVAPKLPFVLPNVSENLKVEKLVLHINILQGSIHQIQRMLTLSSTIKTLDLSSCDLGVGDCTLLLPTLISKALSVRDLNLAANYFGKMESTILENIFNALFELPQLQDLSLNLSDNLLTSYHFSLMHASWINKSSGRKLKYLACGGNYCKDDMICKAVAMNID